MPRKPEVKNKTKHITLRIDSNLEQAIYSANVDASIGDNLSKRVRALIVAGLDNGVVNIEPMLRQVQDLNNNLYPIGNNLNQLTRHFNEMRLRGDDVYIDGIDVKEYLAPILSELNATGQTLRELRQQLSQIRNV